MKEIGEDTNGKLYHAQGLEELILLKWPYYRDNLHIQCNPYYNTNGIFQQTRTNNSKICMETQRS